MTLDQGLAFAACVGELGLALIISASAWARPRGPAIPLALLSLALFMMNFAYLANAISDDASWRLLYVAVVPLLVPLAFHFILGFIGKTRQMRWWLGIGYVVFFALAVGSAWGFVRNAAFGDPRTWAEVLVASLAIPAAWTTMALVRYLRQARGRERRRAWFVATGIVIFVITGVLEILADTGLAVPRAGSIGQVGFIVFLILAAVDLELLGASVNGFLLSLATFAGGFVLLYFLLLRSWSASASLLLIAALGFGICMSSLAYRGSGRLAARRTRLADLVTLGRFSSQMAHDFKNPLSALKGAVQFLRQERACGRSIDGREDFLRLLEDQVDRLSKRVDEYQRMGKMELSRAPHDVNELVENTMGLQKFAAPPGRDIALDVELAPALPQSLVDSDLLSRALQNLVRNAFEAMEQRGNTVRVRTFEDASHICIEVADNGRGMDARTSALAFDDFFTTKATGTGLGLAFVKRVVEAHGGDVTMQSIEDVGTTVTLHLPTG